MISFYINGEPVEVQLEGEETIGDVLRSFEITCEQNHAATIGITVDGKAVTAKEFDSVAEQPLAKDTKFEFSVVTAQDVKQSFAALSQLFANLSQMMEQIPASIQSGNNAEVTQAINKVADSIDQFSYIASLAGLFPQDFENILIDDMNFKNFFAEFNNVLSDFEQAFKNNDTVLIGDLSEYEICPRLKAISESLAKI